MSGSLVGSEKKRPRWSILCAGIPPTVHPEKRSGILLRRGLCGTSFQTRLCAPRFYFKTFIVLARLRGLPKVDENRFLK